MKPWTVTLEEARELSRRAAEVHEKGGIPHAEVVAEMLADMEVELGQMVANYDGSPARARELLEALVIAEEEGVPAPTCAKIRHDLAVRIRTLHAAQQILAMTLKARVKGERLVVDPGDGLDEADRARLHEALRESESDIDAGRLVSVEDVLRELRLPGGRQVIEPLDSAPGPTPEEQQELEEALAALDRGEGADLDDVRADLDAIIRG